MKNTVSSSQCYLCGNDTYIRRQGHCRDNASIYPLECTQCGLVKLSSLNHIDKSYYADAHMHDSEPCEPAIMLQQEQVDTDRRMAQWGDQIAGKHILDFGCGAGGFLLAARDKCASVTGVEPERRLQPFFNEHGLTVYKDLTDIPEKASYDVVTMFHVLEHLSEPLPILQNIRQKIKSAKSIEGGGKLIIEVPSASDALLTLYDNEAFQKFTYWSCHLYLYTEQTLACLLEKAGFRTVKLAQYQRYPIANHLYWLAKGKPGGQTIWKMFNQPELVQAYEKILADEKRADTLIGVFVPQQLL